VKSTEKNKIKDPVFLNGIVQSGNKNNHIRKAIADNIHLPKNSSPK
jgi:hypothetical protein